MDPNGVLGDPRMGNAEAGKAYVLETVEFLYQWAQDQDGSKGRWD
jgi:hypothetical protein